MKALTMKMLAGAIALALPAAALAQEEEEAGGPWALSGEVTLTSDYVWRGVTQTDESPALQAGLDLSHESGFYAGVWGSNVDFDDPDDGIDLEVDIFAGWSWDLNETVNLDLSVTHYMYPGASDGYDIDYNEYTARVTFAETYYGVLGYADDFVNSDIEAMYLQVGGDWALGESGWGLSASVGMFDFDSGYGSYNDFSLGVNKGFGPATFSLTYTATSGFDADVQDLLGPDSWAGSRLQAAIGFEF